MEGYTFPQELWISISEEPLREIFKSTDVAIPPEVAFHPSRHLLGEPHPDLSLDGRAAVLVCSACGDIGCGALFVRIEVGTDRVRWTDFLYGNNYDPDKDDPRPGDYEFDRDSTSGRSPTMTNR